MLKRYTSQVNHGSLRGLARFLGADRLSVVNWLRAKSLPSLDSFLRTCLRLGADPLHIAIFPHVEPPGECYYPRQEAPSSWPPFRRGVQRSLCGRRGPIFWDQVTEALSAMLADPEAGRLSATKTARALGIMTQTLRKRYPVEFAQIQKLHETYLKREGERLLTQRRDRLAYSCRRVCPRRGILLAGKSLSSGSSFQEISIHPRIQANLAQCVARARHNTSLTSSPS